MKPTRCRTSSDTALSTATGTASGTCSTTRAPARASSRPSWTRRSPTCASASSRYWSAGTATGWSGAGPRRCSGCSARPTRQAGGSSRSRNPCSARPGLSGEAMTALGAIVAHQKSVHLGEQVRASHEHIRENGALIGYAPWGYVIVGERYHKSIVPTDECRKYAPQIFERKIAGQSLRSICVWLDAEGVPPRRGTRWNEGSLYQILQNMTYAGRRQDEGPAGADGKPTRKNRRTIMRCEAVVSLGVWRQANEALRASPRRGPGVRGSLPGRPLLAGLRCARCEDSPMYRIRSGDGKYYYRCFGRAPGVRAAGTWCRSAGPTRSSPRASWSATSRRVLLHIERRRQAQLPEVPRHPGGEGHACWPRRGAGGPGDHRRHGPRGVRLPCLVPVVRAVCTGSQILQ